MPAAYSTRADLAAYLEDGLPPGYTDDYFDRVLELASRDIDRFSTAFYATDRPLKLKLESGDWIHDFSSQTIQGITDATCAQAEYRLAQGDQFFVERQRAEGEFSGSQVLQPRIGPKAVEALYRIPFRVRARTATLR